jgi:hypothetical protein
MRRCKILTSNSEAIQWSNALTEHHKVYVILNRRQKISFWSHGTHWDSTFTLKYKSTEQKHYKKGYKKARRRGTGLVLDASLYSIKE